MILGGAEKHVISLARGLRELGYDARIVTVFQEGVLADVVRAEAIPFECMGARRGWGVGTFLKIFRWLSANPVDILHTYLFGFHLYAGLPARLFKIPLVLSSRREIALWRRRRHEVVENLGNFFADRIVCCSRAVEAWTHKKEKLRPGQTATLYNGVDLNLFHPSETRTPVRKDLGIPEHAPLVGTVANFSFEKGYPYLLHAISEVFAQHPEAWFLFVGSGPLEEEIKAKCRQIPRSRQIVFAGYRFDIPDLLRAMNIFTLASVTEGFPNVVLEAMAMGKPVVATRVGGIPELVESGHDGLLVAAKDGHALARAILSLVRDPDRAWIIGRAAQEKIGKNFTREGMIRRYEAFYLSSLRKKGIWVSGQEDARLDDPSATLSVRH